MLDRFVAAEGEPEVLQFSGGEPTIHPDIVPFVGMAKERGIRFVMINTNGIRFARDPAFADASRARSAPVLPVRRLRGRTHLRSGVGICREKERALERCVEAGITVTLVAAIEKGVNEHELGEIVRFGVNHPAVNSIVFQPVTHAGRHAVFDPLERLTNADVMKLVAAQAPDWLRLSDFVPVPCCFPTCRSMCYALVSRAGWPLARMIDVDDYLDYASNRVVPDFEVQHALERMFSSSASPAPSVPCSPARAAASISRPFRRRQGAS